MNLVATDDQTSEPGLAATFHRFPGNRFDKGDLTSDVIGRRLARAFLTAARSGGRPSSPQTIGGSRGAHEPTDGAERRDRAHTFRVPSCSLAEAGRPPGVARGSGPSGGLAQIFRAYRDVPWQPP